MKTDLNIFWDLLHAALGLQHTACRLEQTSNPRDAALYERQALSLLLEATCLLSPEEPVLATVRSLAAAGLRRLHTLQRRSEAYPSQPALATRPPRKGVSPARRTAATRA